MGHGMDAQADWHDAGVTLAHAERRVGHHILRFWASWDSSYGEDWVRILPDTDILISIYLGAREPRTNSDD